MSIRQLMLPLTLCALILGVIAYEDNTSCNGDTVCTTSLEAPF